MAEAMEAAAAAPAATVESAPSALRRMERAVGWLTAVALIGLVVLTCVDVVGRYLLNRPLTGAFELSEMTMGALVFASLPLVTLRRQQVTVDLLDWALPGTRRWRDAAASLVAALCVGVASWRLWIKAAEQMHNGETTAVLKLPMYPLVHAMALLGLLTAGVILVMAWLDARPDREPS